MRSKKQLAKKTVPLAAAASVLVAAGGCATESESSYSPELRPATSPAMESAPPMTAIPDTNTPAQDMDCFLTTACVQAMGLPDHCHELTVLRRFRDQHLMRSTPGRDEVLRYYRIAPQIILALRRTGTPDAESREIYRTLVRPAVDLIEAGHFTAAFAHYRKTVLALARRFGVDSD